MSLTAAADRQNLAQLTHTKSRHPLAASARPFQGGLAGLKTDGYVRPLTGGDPLLGVFERTTDLEDVIASDGGQDANVDRGLQTAVLPVTGVTRADVAKRRCVYASDDGTFTFSPIGTTFIGYVIGVAGTNLAFVQVFPAHFVTPAPGALGLRDLADSAIILTTADLDKVLRQNNTAARTVTLPAAADCAGHYVTVVKNGAAAFAITVQGNGAELIDGANTMATAAARDRLTLVSDGVGWTRIA